jgi:hypothetical protein
MDTVLWFVAREESNSFCCVVELGGLCGLYIIYMSPKLHCSLLVLAVYSASRRIVLLHVDSSAVCCKYRVRELVVQ